MVAVGVDGEGVAPRVGAEVVEEELDVLDARENVVVDVLAGVALVLEGDVHGLALVGGVGGVHRPQLGDLRETVFGAVLAEALRGLSVVVMLVVFLKALRGVVGVVTVAGRRGGVAVLVSLEIPRHRLFSSLFSHFSASFLFCACEMPPRKGWGRRVGLKSVAVPHMERRS